MSHVQMRGAALMLVAMAAAACDDPAGPPDGGPTGPRLSLALPIGGTLNQDWYVTNYMDRQDPGIADYTCGPKSYDGHQGLDLVLPNFAAMDEGLPVLAAAPGTVVWTHDGEPDRNKEWLPDVQWNAIGVDHGSGIEAWYGHLRTGSLRVGEGDAVETGDTLALVGSSGRSDMPHLHFELRHQGAALGSFAGPCGEDADQWADPLEYQDAFHLIDAGVTTDVLEGDLSRVKDPPTPATLLAPGQTLYAWVHYHNLPAGTSTRWTIRRPDGTVHADYLGAHSTFYSMSWWWYFLPTGDFDQAGTWTVEFRHGGALLAERELEVADGAEAMIRGPAAAPGYGGGGIR